MSILVLSFPFGYIFTVEETIRFVHPDGDQISEQEQLRFASSALYIPCMLTEWKFRMPAIKRIMQEAKELANDPSMDYSASPLEVRFFPDSYVHQTS